MRGGSEKGANPVRFVASFSCCLVNLLSGILCRLLCGLGSLVHLFLGHSMGILSRVGRLALGGTEGMFSGIHYLLASINCAGETFSHRLIDL